MPEKYWDMQTIKQNKCSVQQDDQSCKSTDTFPFCEKTSFMLCKLILNY